MSKSLHNWLVTAALVGSSSIAAAQQPGTNVPTAPPAAAPAAPVTATDSPVVAVTPGPAPVVSDPNEPVIDAATTRSTFLNRPLFVTGLIVLGGSYGASAIVGATTDRADDKKLVYPVVGPWMDLANRDCGAQECPNQNTYKALLIGDGILQGIGALGILTSLFVPEKTTRHWYLIGQEGTHVGPMSVGRSGYGVGAYGSF